MRIGLIAAEESGDILGADLIQSLKTIYPNAIFEGVGGPRMISQGLQCLHPMERLSVMGFIEPLKRLPEILCIRSKLKRHFINNPPDVFIGIDFTEFNLSFEKALRKMGIKTVHYVSPTVWAWRKGRIKTIKKAVDLMLTLFPFETAIYQENKIPFAFVGHPLANKIPLTNDKQQARATLGLPSDKTIVAILPGSRAQELKYIAPEFIKMAKWLRTQNKDLCFISAAPNDLREQQFKTLQNDLGFNEIQVFKGQSTSVMAAADVIAVASGTASLEAMLVKRPTIVAYKMSALTYSIAKRLIKVPFIALPNLLSQTMIMPEFVQDKVIPSIMGKQIMEYINELATATSHCAQWETIHRSLQRDLGANAALAIKRIIEP